MELRKLSKIDAKSKGIYDRTRANGKSHYHKLPAIHRSSLIDETKENQKCRNSWNIKVLRLTIDIINE